MILVTLFLTLATGFSEDTIDLSGEWRLRLDPEDRGVQAGWGAAPMVSTNRIVLPTTTDLAGFGFELGTLAPGQHRLTVRVDNRLIDNLTTVPHAYGPETQSRWNGLIGALKIQAAPAVSVRSIKVFPAADRLSAQAIVVFANSGDASAAASLSARLLPAQGAFPLAESIVSANSSPGLSTNQVTLKLRAPAEPWDEFSTVRYRLQVRVETKASAPDETTALFGFRHIERVARKIRVNGRPVFLRGTLDCAVYPKTGHPPMTVEEWERVLGVVKEYGFQ